MLSVTDTVTSIVPLPVAGDTVIQSGTSSITQSASAYTVIVFGCAPSASKFSSLALASTAFESVVSSSLQLPKSVAERNSTEAMI